VTLHEFLVRNELSYRQAAKFFGIDHSTIYKYVQGHMNPSLKNAIKIKKRSKGFIRIEDLYEEKQGE